MSSLFPPFDPYDRNSPDGGPPRRRIGRLPVRMIIPSLITLLGLSLGMMSIRLSMEGRYDVAVGAIILAGLLDALDGRVARFLKATSRFGAELDSLSDFLCFGCAPALLLYSWTLHDVKTFGWIAALLFAIAAALRLARFNVMLTSEQKPAWQANFFVGVPAPAGAILALLPVSLAQVFPDVDPPEVATPLVALYLVFVGILMVSRVPTFSGKKMGGIRRDLVIPLLVAFVLLCALAVNFPFEMLAAGTLIYLVMLPLGWRSWNKLARLHGATAEAVTLDLAPDEGEEEAENDADSPGGSTSGSTSDRPGPRF